jgi:toxin HigB-1
MLRLYFMIKSFKHSNAPSLQDWIRPKNIPPDVAKRVVRKMALINAATQIMQLQIPPSNRLHILKGDRKGQWSISVNDQWRICFLWIDGNAYDVEFIDYH